MTNFSRPVCILDTDTLLFSFKLDCPPNKVIHRLDQQFELLFPHKVQEEYENKRRQGTLREYDDVISDINLFLKKKNDQKKVIEEHVYWHCLKHLKRFFNKMKMQKQYHTLGEGEKHCAALGLYMSRLTRDCVIVVTDDFGARKAGIDLFVYRQFVGLVRSLLSTMVFVYCVNTNIPDSRMLGLVNDYFNLNPPHQIGMQNFKDIILENIGLCCRRQSYIDCKFSCLT